MYSLRVHDWSASAKFYRGVSRFHERLVVDSRERSKLF